MTLPKGFKKKPPPPHQPQYHTRSGKAIAILLAALMSLAVLFAVGGAFLVFLAWVDAPQPIVNRNGIIALVLGLLMFIVSSSILGRRYGGKKEGAEERPPLSSSPILTTTTSPVPPPQGVNNNNHPMPIKSKKLPTHGKHDAVIGGLIFAAIIIIIITVIVWFIYSENQKYIDRGCTPAAWNSWGDPTIWNCPKYGFGG